MMGMPNEDLTKDFKRRLIGLFKEFVNVCKKTI